MKKSLRAYKVLTYGQTGQTGQTTIYKAFRRPHNMDKPAKIWTNQNYNDNFSKIRLNSAT